MHYFLGSLILFPSGFEKLSAFLCNSVCGSIEINGVLLTWLMVRSLPITVSIINSCPFIITFWVVEMNFTRVAS